MIRSGILFLALIGVASRSSGQTPFEGSRTLIYEGGHVLGWDAPAYHMFTLYRANGSSIFALPQRGADNTSYVVWAADTDGVAVRGYHDGQEKGRIDLLDATGKAARTIDTGSYNPTHLTFAPDHSIWAVGYLYPCEPSVDFNVVRHYARTGEKLGEAVPWSQIAADNNAYTALQPFDGGRGIFSASGRIGFITLASSGHGKWIELTFSGDLLGQYDLGSYGRKAFWPLAITTGGSVYGRISEDGSFAGYGLLNKSEATWSRVTGYPAGKLIGADGENLVFSRNNGGWTVLENMDTKAFTLQRSQPGTKQ